MMTLANHQESFIVLHHDDTFKGKLHVLHHVDAGNLSGKLHNILHPDVHLHTPMIFHGCKSQGLLLQVVTEKNSGMDTNSGLEIQVL
jgi:hypothetical protein